jgi:ADP-ribose pyrophosphatase
MFNDLWFKVRKDICETPEGKIVNPYYVYEFPTWVTAFALTEDGKVIMVKQYRHALGEICLELPGGCVDETDKSPEDAIARELLEETGYAFSSFEYLGRISANPSTNNNLMHMFLARNGKKIAAPSPDGNEELEVQIFTMEEIKQLIRENKIVQAMHVCCILYAWNRLGLLVY